MTITKRILMVLLAIVSLTFAIVILGSGSARKGNTYLEDKAMTKTQSKSTENRCGGLVILEGDRMKLKTYGYPHELPLTEAIEIFNKENQCEPMFASYPPLTESELIAAVVAGADDGNQGTIWRAQKDILWKIASSKQMPKGALLVARSGGREIDTPINPNGTIAARGITIALLLDLDDSEDGILKPRKPEQAFVIRKTYFAVETINK
jgi:hypothetical protein